MSATIIPALGKSYNQFILTPNIIAILMGIGFTILFTVVIYAIALRKVKSLKLSDMA